MSLIKQLWLGIALLLLLTFGGSFAVSTWSAKTYLEQQLQLKNIDNASSLALSISQMEKDPVLLELLIAAQFDTGHYQRIELRDPQGNLIAGRHYQDTAARPAPSWFMGLLSLEAAPGTAQIQDGWQQFGTLTLESHSHFAWASLWQGTQRLLLWFVIAALLSGLLGTAVLKYISRPLDMVVGQAEAIGERRFVTYREPRTREFQRVVRAMNKLSNSVRTMLEHETQQLEQLRRESQQDLLTGLANREHFLKLLDSLLRREDSDRSGTLLIARVRNLPELNRRLGHRQTDRALQDIAAVFHLLSNNHPGSHAGRLNGSDFVFMAPGPVTVLGTELARLLDDQLRQQTLSDVALPVAGCSYSGGDTRVGLLTRLDGALAEAEQKGDRALVILDEPGSHFSHSPDQWRTLLNQALEQQRLQLGQFAVNRMNGELLHLEAPVRLELDGQWQPAGHFISWANRLKLMPAIDLLVVRAALEQLDSRDTSLAINLSEDSLRDAWFRNHLTTELAAVPDKAARLWLELPEACALRHREDLRAFCALVTPLGCRVGLEHVGAAFTYLKDLQDLGLHYLKVDRALVHALDSDPGNSSFLQSLCRIGHSLGILMIAEGVETAEEIEALQQVGIDAVTGPGVKNPIGD